MKRIDIQCTRWFQKSYGNTYFTALVTVDYGKLTEREIYLPFQYGYDEHYLDIVKRELFPEEKYTYEPLWRICSENRIRLRVNVQDVRRKKDMI